jgi:hypothetical protein
MNALVRTRCGRSIYVLFKAQSPATILSNQSHALYFKVGSLMQRNQYYGYMPNMEYQRFSSRPFNFRELPVPARAPRIWSISKGYPLRALNIPAKYSKLKSLNQGLDDINTVQCGRCGHVTDSK